MAGSAVEALQRLGWESLGVAYAIAFGSAVRDTAAARDLDLLVRFRPGRGGLDDEVAVMEAAEKATGLPVDLYVLDPERPDCTLVSEALRTGILVYLGDRHTYADDTVRVVNVCYDSELSKRKLRYTETVLRAVIERWGL